MAENNLWEKDLISKKRFRFGKNWLQYSKAITIEKINHAEDALKKLIGLNSFERKSFLDVGCGSGLMSLAARRLGAQVYSFDFDKESVNCTQRLKERYFPNDKKWTISEASALDKKFLNNLGKWDIVYSWGVLHHTGNMWLGLENMLYPLTSKEGILYIAIYNDEGSISNIWLKIKKFYNLNKFNEMVVKLIFIPFYSFVYVFFGLIKYKNPFYFFTNYKNKNRGMSIFYDFIDWLGGYPYEVAKPEEIINFYQDKGLKLINLKTTNRLGCNEYVFKRSSENII